jgi:hypothetical protein
LIDAIDPVARTPHGPVGRQPLTERALPPPKGTPPPGFCSAYQSGTQCISFHVTADGQEVSVALDWEALETVLVHMPLTHRAVRRAKSLAMCSREVPEKAGELILIIRFDMETITSLSFRLA